LCPGGAYDRSPCGTGTSAKLACLAADGILEENQVWRQESVVGSLFEAFYQMAGPDQLARDAGSQPTVIPTITGSAYICGEGVMLFDGADPFVFGISEQSPASSERVEESRDD
jgi:4-hydroxyproline epimerase